MTPREVKDLAREAVAQHSPSMALEACSEIIKQDLYINKPERPVGDGSTITVRYGDRPCRAKCGEDVMEGSTAWWQPGVGLFHMECVSE